MRWGRRALVSFAVIAAAAIAPSVALANDPADSISLAAPAGPNDAGYPITFTGAGTDDGTTDDGGYSTFVVWAPTSSGVLGSSCPQSYAAAAQAIDYYAGGDLGIYDFQADGDTTNALGEIGPYSYSATANDMAGSPTLTEPGAYVACAYLTDIFNNTTYAVSGMVPFSVGEPPGSGQAPGGFGGPPGKTGHPSDLTLKVGLSRALRDPGRNLLEISGRESDPSADAGPEYLQVDVNLASRYNGCASNDQQNKQIVESDGGAVLATEAITPSTDGSFRSPIALDFKRRVPGTYVVCAYLGIGIDDDDAVGFDRISVPRAHRSTRHTHHHHRRSPRKHKR